MHISIKNYPGFRADSHTLLGPVVVAGACMGNDPSDILDGDLLTFDSSLEVTSGDIVAICLLAGPTDLGIQIACKQIEAIGNKWWLASFDGLGPLSQSRHRLMGRLVQSIHFPREWPLRDRALHTALVNEPAGWHQRMLQKCRPAYEILAAKGFDRRTIYRDRIPRQSAPSASPRSCSSKVAADRSQPA